MGVHFILPPQYQLSEVFNFPNHFLPGISASAPEVKDKGSSPEQSMYVRAIAYLFTMEQKGKHAL
ncbi:hypothetical protein FC093_00930 [Ilyomonas limi]|uniref:Uncharacterized protein n=1 Tax=Ilyomonas limi TaxID=2575867 RepID=A0A4U3LAC9_9BACT|nr:hypothetical protein FC093_00930 [Ilyomonas limi]